MTVRVERTFRLDVAPEAVWTFISDPGRRAEAISVVDSWERDGEETIWHVRLPIPLVNRTVPVRTRDAERVEGERVRFVGRSRVMRVQGEHELESDDGGTIVSNRFVVDGSIPGVERYFEKHLDEELENLRLAMERELVGEATDR